MSEASQKRATKIAGQVQSIIKDAFERAQLDDGETGVILGSPDFNFFNWYSFPQVWPSTSAMSGGPGGQAMTTAQTTAVFIAESCYVYCGAEFIYQLSDREARQYLVKRDFPNKTKLGRSQE